MTSPNALKRQRQREQMLQERMTCLGGSDVVDLMGFEPYGCTRKLFYEKTGTVPDFPDLGNVHTRRGTLLEPVAVEVYEEETGRRCDTTKFLRHPIHPFLGVHIDRVQYDKDSIPLGDGLSIGFPPKRQGWGALEIKVPTHRNWMQIKATGCPGSYELQLQWGMMVSGWLWGTVAVFSPERMENLCFDRERDEELRKSLIAVGQDFWKRVEYWGQVEAQTGTQCHNPYDRLEPNDPRCATCPYRQRCQGLGEVPERVADQEQLDTVERAYVADESLAALADTYLQLKADKAAAEKAYQEVEAKFKEAIAERSAVECSVAKVYWHDYERKGYTVEPRKVRTLKVVPKLPEPID